MARGRLRMFLGTAMTSGLTPGVSYDITLVAVGDGVRSDNISISRTTPSRGESTVHVVSCMCDGQG